MGERGPVPTPTAILRARGSWRADTREGEIQFTSGAPKCPAFLDKEAKAEWKRQVKELESAGVVQQVDGAALAIYCEAWSEFIAVVKLIAENGRLTRNPNDRIVRSPLLDIRNKAAERLLRVAMHFGFTPSARARIAVPPADSADGPDSVERFFKGA